MNAPTTHNITWPGSHSAKNAYRAGAPNHHQGSGENPMVDSTPVDLPTLAQVQDHLIATRPQWLTTAPRVIVSITRLARVVHAMLTAHTAPFRKQAADLADQVWSLSTANGELQRESDLREQEIIALMVERDRALAEVDRLETEKLELGQGIAARDKEVIDLTADLEQADARLAALASDAERGEH